MRTLKSCFELSTSYWDNCDFPFVKQGILRTATGDAISSWKLKPLSARKRSPKVNFLRNPNRKVICLSDTRPPYPDERKLTYGLILVGDLKISDKINGGRGGGG